MKLNKYPDNTSYVNNTQLGPVIFRINSYEDLWHLNQFVDAFHSEHDTLLYKINPNIIIPCLLDAQADRRFNKGESFGLKLVLEFLNGLKANFKIFHPHNPEVVQIVMDNVEIIDNTEFIKQVLWDIGQVEGNERGPLSWNKPQDNLILMSSDAGGFKPLMKLADKLEWTGETYSASKARKYKDGETILTQLVDRQDFGGKDILITDDLMCGGGTFIGIANLLKQKNVGKLYLAVSHITISEPNPLVFKVFDKVYTTDSKGLEYKIDNEQPKNLKIIYGAF